MNAIFLSLFLGATAILLFVNPPLFLPTVLDAAGDAATLCVALLASYAVWMGLMEVWKACGITRGIAKVLRPVCKRLFRTDDEQTLQTISVNLSCNLLGLGAAATPYGIEGARLLDKAPHAEYASCMFFVLNATSLQLLPTSVVGLRASLGSGAAADIVVPSLLSTAFSTVVACLLVWLFLRPKWHKKSKKSGAGTR
jgi:spore maturation protein A